MIKIVCLFDKNNTKHIIFDIRRSSDSDNWLKAYIMEPKRSSNGLIYVICELFNIAQTIITYFLFTIKSTKRGIRKIKKLNNELKCILGWIN